ncbi:hypothetical protein M2436_007266 [Streptomyces sp. HB372]|nr:hypothetical protein [Streptomyces sp. HB372]
MVSRQVGPPVLQRPAGPRVLAEQFQQGPFLRGSHQQGRGGYRQRSPVVEQFPVPCHRRHLFVGEEQAREPVEQPPCDHGHAPEHRRSGRPGGVEQHQPGGGCALRLQPTHHLVGQPAAGGVAREGEPAAPETSEQGGCQPFRRRLQVRGQRFAGAVARKGGGPDLAAAPERTGEVHVLVSPGGGDQRRQADQVGLPSAVRQPQQLRLVARSGREDRPEPGGHRQQVARLLRGAGLQHRAEQGGHRAGGILRRPRRGPGDEPLPRIRVQARHEGVHPRAAARSEVVGELPDGLGVEEQGGRDLSEVLPQGVRQLEHEDGVHAVVAERGGEVDPVRRNAEGLRGPVTEVPGQDLGPAPRAGGGRGDRSPGVQGVRGDLDEGGALRDGTRAGR